VALHRGKGVLAEGKRDEAVELLRGALVDAPASEAAGEIAFLLGGTYLEAYDNKDSAAAAFRKAASSPGPEERKSIATERAQYLGEYLDLEKELAAGTADTAQVQFLLAEHDLFSFGEPDSALVRYRLVSGRFPESDYAARALAAEEYIAGRRPGGAALSDSLLLRLVRVYPRSPEAVEVLDRGAVRVDGDSLALWTERWVLAHPEPESTATDTAAAAEEGEGLPVGSEGDLAAGFDPAALDEGPPAPLRLETRVEPAYPLFPEGAEKPDGFAEIQVDVAADGKVQNARVVRSSEKAFEGPALAAAYQCRFVPETNSGTRETNLRFDFRPGPR
jgi:TonB family protein